MSASKTDGINNFDTNQAARALGVGRDIILAECEARTLTFYFVGKRRRFDRQDLDDFKKRQREKGEIEPCPSTKNKTGRTGTSTSSSNLIDFTALRAQRQNAKQGTSNS